MEYLRPYKSITSVMNCLTMQCHKPRNYVPMNQQKLNSPRTFVPTNIFFNISQFNLRCFQVYCFSSIFHILIPSLLKINKNIDIHIISIFGHFSSCTTVKRNHSARYSNQLFSINNFPWNLLAQSLNKTICCRCNRRYKAIKSLVWS